MILNLEHSEVIYGDGLSVHRSLYLPRDVVVTFLESLFKKLYRVDRNRSCHLCSEPCQSALTLHFGQPFQQHFKSCVPM